MSIVLGKDVSAKVEKWAQEHHRTPQQVADEAIEQYLERAEFREQVRLDVEASSKHYQETGLHLTGEEVDEWLSKLGAGENVPPPPCHT